ncbi:hypothetical protein P168DRAFT_317060 [Aspergillus campestris IBT 28561]|uniref:Uncharacterized protein n=1 Tax=Aspergillus campestris (strain IBT 28561) TaxID=1392248 RepID=A0A2I1D6P2_ASPC2|nr:uncharacterized protein P168DRAFT_317060 [Aspergillus campestris IBT 28561]PKY05538.1 hypothetical protein P168DRAFT_317060 [Aspergillus campestris IBT 28561]
MELLTAQANQSHVLDGTSPCTPRGLDAGKRYDLRSRLSQAEVQGPRPTHYWLCGVELAPCSHLDRAPELLPNTCAQWVTGSTGGPSAGQQELRARTRSKMEDRVGAVKKFCILQLWDCSGEACTAGSSRGCPHIAAIGFRLTSMPVLPDGQRASRDVVSGNANVKQSASRGRVDLPLGLRCGVNHDRLSNEGLFRC